MARQGAPLSRAERVRIHRSLTATQLMRLNSIMNAEPIEWDDDVDKLIDLGLVARNKKKITLNQTMLEITRWGSNILQQDWEEFQERKRRK